MKRMCDAVASIAAAMIAVGTVQAGILVEETFDTDGTIDDYTGSGKVFADYRVIGNELKPDIEVLDGKLKLEMATTSVTNVYTLISLGGARTLLSFRFDYQGVQFSAATTAWSLYTGSFALISQFDPGWNIHQGARNWSLARVPGTNSYAVVAVDGLNVAHSSSTGHAIGTWYTWSYYANETGAAEQFTGPDGEDYDLDTACWSLFVGPTLVADNVPKGTTGDNTSLQGIVFNVGRNYPGATSKSAIDNIVVRDDLKLYEKDKTTLLTIR
jgi:hypothetical protein